MHPKSGLVHAMCPVHGAIRPPDSEGFHERRRAFSPGVLDRSVRAGAAIGTAAAYCAGGSGTSKRSSDMSTRLWTSRTIESTSLAAIRSRPASSLRIVSPSSRRASVSQRAAVARCTPYSLPTWSMLQPSISW